MSQDRLAARLLATFLAELEEQVQTMNADLLALEAQPADAERLNSLFRVAHTLKGAARAVGVPLIEEACHRLEMLLAKARDRQLALGREEFSLLFSAADALADAGERLRAGQELQDAPLVSLLRTLRGFRVEADRAPAAPVGPAAPARHPPAGEQPDGGGAAAVPALARGAAAEAPFAEGGREQIRVPAEKLDLLLAASEQLLNTCRRVAARAEELQELHDLAADGMAAWRRLSRRLRSERDASPRSSPGLRSVDALEERLRRLLHDTAHLAGSAAVDTRALTQVSEDVREGVHRLRMRPFAEACEALPRVVRDLASTIGREVRLEIAGKEVEADRAVLDGLREALLHLVRNAVDHGIEPPAARERAGKPRTGTVAVAAAIRDGRIIVTVSDDGAGLDLPAIRAQLERRGLPVPAEERELARTLFAGGFSTRMQATAISGRGVGLDIVQAAVERIHGRVEVAAVAGQGTTFTLECPPTLATLRALLATVGEQILAFPVSHVEYLVRIRREEIRRAEGREVITTAAAPVPLVALARLLGPPLIEKPATDPLSVIRLLAGGNQLAVAVDGFIEERELVVRPLEHVHHPSPFLSGAALLGTGEVALVLNPAALVAGGLQAARTTGVLFAEAASAAPPRRRILVADDSITTRTLEQSILESAGYQVLTAVDGADAWKILQEQGADLVVSDVEMPRMDGFTLCEAIRASKRFRELPVVLITALEAPAHRERGLEVGADAYLAKSSFEQQNLLETIRQLIG